MRTIRSSGSGARELDGFCGHRSPCQGDPLLDFELVLTGIQADDDNLEWSGIMVAEKLGTETCDRCSGGRTGWRRGESQGGTGGRGMDEVRTCVAWPFDRSDRHYGPRYMSIMGIRKARKKELNVTDVEELGPS